MEGAVEKLQQVNLSEYEAKTYLALINVHLSTATQVSEKSGVPRTKIYSVLESLSHKGWIRVYSGVPLLFKAVAPANVFEKVKKDFAQLLDSVQGVLRQEENDMKEKFVIKRFDVGLDRLKAEIEKAKTVEINNAATFFLRKVNDAFREDALIRVLLFPGEVRGDTLPNALFKNAEIAIVTIVHNREVPSISITLDEERTFTVFQDPVDNKFIVDEMLYDECQHCFAGWSNMSWSASNP